MRSAKISERVRTIGRSFGRAEDRGRGRKRWLANSQQALMITDEQARDGYVTYYFY
jgi:hypothetical protein